MLLVFTTLLAVVVNTVMSSNIAVIVITIVGAGSFCKCGGRTNIVAKLHTGAVRCFKMQSSAFPSCMVSLSSTGLSACKHALARSNFGYSSSTKKPDHGHALP